MTAAPRQATATLSPAVCASVGISPGKGLKARDDGDDEVVDGGTAFEGRCADRVAIQRVLGEGAAPGVGVALLGGTEELQNSRGMTGMDMRGPFGPSRGMRWVDKGVLRIEGG